MKSEVADPSDRKSGSETTILAATPPLEPSTPTPVSTLGPGAPTSSSAALERLLTANRENQAATPLIRTRAPASPDLARAPIFHKRIDRLSQSLPTLFHPHFREHTDSNPASGPCSKNVRSYVRRGPRRDRRIRYLFTDRAAPGSATPATENPETKPPRGGQAAAVAGYAGPGFHNWPPGHILQATDPKPLLRIRSTIPSSLMHRSPGSAPVLLWPAFLMAGYCKLKSSSRAEPEVVEPARRRGPKKSYR